MQNYKQKCRRHELTCDIDLDKKIDEKNKSQLKAFFFLLLPKIFIKKSVKLIQNLALSISDETDY